MGMRVGAGMSSRAGRSGGKWVRIDRRYNQPLRLTGYAWRVIIKWGVLLIIWLSLVSSRNAFLAVISTLALLAYGVHRLRRRNQLNAPPVQTAMGMPAPPAAVMPMRFNPPPGWPPAPPGWIAPPGWQPDPAWAPAPPGWQLWVQDNAPIGERNTRAIPQDVRIAVAVRDQGRCRQCGSAQELHYDHVIPWSRGGANTVNNIQLLCGPCNRAKGAEDIPV